MKRYLILIMVLGLILGAVSTAEAGKKKKKKKQKKVEREATGTYTSTIVVAVGTCSQQDAVNCVRIPSGPDEKYITATVTDATGQGVPVAVKADLDGDNSTEKLYGTFCGETEEPIEVDPGVEVTFWVGVTADTAALACPPATEGSIDVVFSNLP
ncbi:MAG: hypothetical protein ACR2KQ_08485 [Actinomycetota bacterium]